MAKAFCQFLAILNTIVGCQLTFQLFASCQLLFLFLPFVSYQVTRSRPSVNVNAGCNYEFVPVNF